MKQGFMVDRMSYESTVCVLYQPRLSSHLITTDTPWRHMGVLLELGIAAS